MKSVPLPVEACFGAGHRALAGLPRAKTATRTALQNIMGRWSFDRERERERSMCQGQATHRIEPVYRATPVQVDENNRDGCLNTAATVLARILLYANSPPVESIHSLPLGPASAPSSSRSLGKYRLKRRLLPQPPRRSGCSRVEYGVAAAILA